MYRHNYIETAAYYNWIENPNRTEKENWDLAVKQYENFMMSLKISHYTDSSVKDWFKEVFDYEN